MDVTVNGEPRAVPPTWQEDTLLFVLRKAFGLTGARFGCGQGLCGACTVLLDDAPVRSCLVPVAEAAGRAVRTVEGLAGPDGFHPVQAAWLAEAVPQCGFCQAGQIVAAVALLERDSDPTEEDVVAALGGNLCRCGTYGRIRRAVRPAAQARP